MNPSVSGPLREQADVSSAASEVTLYVCVTCLSGEDRDTRPRAGQRLHDALVAARDRQPSPAGFRLVETECLSNCNRGCSIALAGAGRWSYVYGDLSESAVDDIIAGSARYAATIDGLVPWRERPAIFRKGVIARIPPAAAPAPDA